MAAFCWTGCTCKTEARAHGQAHQKISKRALDADEKAGLPSMLESLRSSGSLTIGGERFRIHYEAHAGVPLERDSTAFDRRLIYLQRWKNFSQRTRQFIEALLTL